MKKFYLRTLVLHIVFFLSIMDTFSQEISSYDCKIDGINYNLNKDDRTAIVTYSLRMVNHSTGMGILDTYTYISTYSGNVAIPETIIYENVTYKVVGIDHHAFVDCKNLNQVEIPNSIIDIGYNAFYGCIGLTSISIPSSVETISSSAFLGCTNLEYITLNSNAIVSKTYTSSSNLGQIFGSQVNHYELGNNISHIGDYAFCKCENLTSITISSGVTSIGTSAFSNCPNLKNITLNSNTIVSQTYTSSFNLKNIFGSQVTHYELGNSITQIGDYAFYECENLTSIDIPEGVTSIGDYAFDYCKGVTSVTIPNSVTSIGRYAFFYSSCKEFTLPDNIAYIGGAAFYYDNCKIYINRGTISLLALWQSISRTSSCTIYERGTNTRIYRPKISDSSSTTQTSISPIISNALYNEYKYYLEYTTDGITEYVETENKKKIPITGLYPGQKVELKFYICLGSISYLIDEVTMSTNNLSPVINAITTPSTIHLTGTYRQGDANVTSESVSIYKYNNGTTNNSNLIKTAQGSKLSLTGLDPNTSYTVEYSIVANGRTYTDKKTVTTNSLTLNTLEAKVVSVGNVIVCAKSNLDDEENNVGFEWRRSDWPDNIPTNSGVAYLYDGTMEGYIRNLYANAFWKYRPYYVSDSGKKYYGEWIGFDPTNTSYFEPTVHTYAPINVNGNTASVKGYAMTGTDKITSQGFMYWKDGVNEIKGMAAAQKVVSVPSNAMTVEASGQVMTANITGLDYNSTYHYVAFAITSEDEVYYGEEQVFTTGEDPTGIEGVQKEAAGQKTVTVVARYNMNGQAINSPQKGINILRMSDGTVRKVLVK